MSRLKKAWNWSPAASVLGVCILILWLSAVVWSQNQNFQGGNSFVSTTNITFGGSSPSSVYTLFPSTSSACTPSTYSQSGTITCAVNAITGAISQGTDLRAVWDAVLAASPNGGHFFFKQGTYNCNTLDSESTGGFTNAYCIGFPAGGATQYQKWILEGEAEDQIIDQFASTVQTNGTIINLTAAARATVTATRKITLLWARKDVANGIGPSVRLIHLGLRVPDNQRGCESFSDLSNALNAEYDHVFADTGVAQASLALPIQTACTAWGFADPGGLMGLISTDSSKEHTDYNWSYTMGADVGFDVRTEHTSIEQSAAVDGNHCIDYGVRGFAIFHSSFWQSIGCGETQRALTLGTNLQLGSALTVFGFDLEDAQPGGAQTIFQAVYHFLETNVGATNGLISYSDTLQNIGLQGLLNVFDGGGGTSFTILQATSQHNLSRTPGTDTFTRANIVGLGPAWAVSTINTNTLKISGNTAQCNSATTISCAAIFLGQQFAVTDQFSQVTVNTIDANASSNVEVLTNLSNSAITFYGYYCSGAAATGSGIFKRVAGVTTTLSSQTAVIGCANGDIIRLTHIGTWLYAFRNGVLDKNFTPNPVTDSSITGGNPGFELAQDTAAGAAITNFIGGMFPTITGADSIYAAANPTFTPFLLSVGTAPTPTGTGACATITTQVPASLGNRAGSFKCTGITGASTVTLTFVNVAPNGYRCSADDETTVADKPTQTSFTVTTCVLTTAATAANDVITWNAEPF